MTTRARYLILALLASLAVGLLAAGCGGDDSSSEDAQALLEKAFGKEVNSGDLEIDAEAQIDGLASLAGPLTFSMSGPFKTEDRRQVPVLDWDISAQGAGQELDAGLIVAEDNAFVEYGGESYEVGPELFGQIQEQYARQRPEEEPTLRSYGIDPATWLEEPRVEDGEDIGGDPTRVVTGSVDVEKVVRDLYSLTRSDAFRRQLESQGQTVPEVPEPSDEDIDKIVEAVDRLELEVNVDEQDTLRRLALDADFTVPEGTGDGQIKGGSLSFAFTLNEVGVEPQIEVPSDPRPLTELTQRFGGVLGGGVPQPTP